MGERMAKLFLFCIAPVAVCCAVLIDKRLRDASRMHKRSQQEPMMGALKGHHPSSPATTTTTSHHQLTTTAAAAAAAASASTGCPSCKRISTSYNTRASHEIGRKKERERLARSYITLLLLRVGCQWIHDCNGHCCTRVFHLNIHKLRAVNISRRYGEDKKKQINNSASWVGAVNHQGIRVSYCT